MKLSELPDDIRKKIEQNNKSALHKEKSIQIYASDLSRIFDIGEIADMFVVVVDHKQVLRIRYYEKEAEEFQTITVPKKPTASKPRASKPSRRDNYKPRNNHLQFDRDAPEPDTRFGSKAAEFGGKIGKGLVTWIRTPPRKRPEDW